MLGRQGLTLMEVLVVVLIIGAAVSFSLPNFTRPNEQALSQNAVNNLLAIYSAQQNYFNNHGYYCFSTSTTTCPNLAAINSVLSLNIQDNGAYTYVCDTTYGAIANCRANRQNPSAVPIITVYLTGVHGAIQYPLSSNVNPYSGSCSPMTTACPFLKPMRMKNLNNSAFSLLEILLAAMIFVISIAGIFATLNAVRTPVTNKENALAAAVFGKQVLEALRSGVSAQTSSNFYSVCPSPGSCSTFDLELGLHSITPLPSGLSWPSTDLNTANSNTLTYTVSCSSTGSTTFCSPDVARRVDLNINW